MDLIDDPTCGGCQYWDGATCMNPMSGSYGRDTDEGCERKGGETDEEDLTRK